MEGGSVFRRSLDGMEEEFRRFRRSTIEEYERELERVRAERELKREEGFRLEAEKRRTLAETGVNLDRLNEIERAEQGRLDEFLSRVRSRLIGREAHNDRDLRERVIRSAFYDRFGWKQANLIGADLLAPDRESLEGVEGEVGNPSVWLYNANKVKYSRAHSGSGWGCFSNYGDEPPGKVIWYYSWVPPKNRKYMVYAQVNYHGFYVLRADDSWYNCKHAQLMAWADIELNQYFPRGKRTYWITVKGGDNVDTAGFVDGSAHWSFHEYLSGGDLVLIRVCFCLYVEGRGSGDYAELNFKDGKANFIDAPVVGFI